MKVKLDFENKTIDFEGDVTLADVRQLRDSLVDADEWRIVKGVQFVTIPQPYTANPLLPQPWGGGGTFI